MARKRRTTKLRPKTPSRVKRRKPTRRGPRARAHQHPELIGLALAAVGIFLASVLYARWNGGYVGSAMVDGLRAAIGDTAYGLPVTLGAVGSLMLARSSLLDVRPFRTGLALAFVGLLLVLGRSHGGYLGRGLGWAFGAAIGTTGTTILGVFALLVASTASLRVRQPAPFCGTRAGRCAAPVATPAVGSSGRSGRSPASSESSRRPACRPGAHARRRRARLPRRRGERGAGRRAAAARPRGDAGAASSRCRPKGGDYRLPDRAILRRSAPVSAKSAESSARSPRRSSRRSRTSASTRRSSARSAARA